MHERVNPCSINVLLLYPLKTSGWKWVSAKLLIRTDFFAHTEPGNLLTCIAVVHYNVLKNKSL